MAHIRKEIRDDIITTVTGLDTTGKNVFRSRVHPITANKLPAIAVFNKSEEVLYGTQRAPRLQERTAVYDIEIYVKATTDYDNTLDQICLEVEEALTTDLTRGNSARDTRITSFVADFNGDGEQPLAVARLTVEVTYQVRENNPDVSI